MQSWQMQEAKARFSELVKSAQQDGPQEITMHGKPIAVLLSLETFGRLSGSGESLLAFMQRSPLHGLEGVEFERDKTPAREIEL